MIIVSELTQKMQPLNIGAFSDGFSQGYGIVPDARSLYCVFGTSQVVRECPHCESTRVRRRNEHDIGRIGRWELP